MVTFLVLNIIMTIVTAGAAIIVTIALAVWSGAVVDTSKCVTIDGSCTCYTNDYSSETYDGENIEFRHNSMHVIVRFSYVSKIVPVLVDASIIILRHDSIE